MSIHPLPSAVRDSTPSIEQEELRGISRTVAEIHWLLLILVLLYTIFGGDADKEAEAAVLAASFFYAAFVLSFRYANFYRRESRWKVALETWAMIAFITWVLYFSGGLSSPLLNSYLLPVIDVGDACGDGLQLRWRFQAWQGAGYRVISGCESGPLQLASAASCTIGLNGGAGAALRSRQWVAPTRPRCGLAERQPKCCVSRPPTIGPKVEDETATPAR